MRGGERGAVSFQEEGHLYRGPQAACRDLGDAISP